MTAIWGGLTGLEKDTWVEAAVLALQYREKSQDYLVLTQRTEDVVHHKGQICLPGGSHDPIDQNLWETALRETQEELGVPKDRIVYQRELKPQFTPTGFRVTPYVGQLEGPFRWEPNPGEIAQVILVPFTYFQDPQNLSIHKKIYENQEYIDPQFLYEGTLIWGMTSRVICELFEIIPKKS